MKKQQTVRGIPHWGKFKDAVRYLHQDADHFKAMGELRFFEALNKIASAINEGVKFYVPDVSNIISNKDLVPPFDGEKYLPFRLPYPVTILLSNTNIVLEDIRTSTEEQVESHKISVLIQEEDREDLDIRCASVIYVPLTKKWVGQPAIGRFRLSGGFHDGRMGYAVEWNRDKWTAEFLKVCQSGYLKDNEVQQMLEDFQDDFMSMATLCKLLEINDCKQVSVNVPPKLAKKHSKRGEAGAYDYKVLSIGGETWDSPYLGGGNGGGGGGGAKRSHMRRGHIRTYQNGKKVWINSTYVHGNREGFVEKDYRLKGGSDAK
jgi:hypothetical protein